MRSSFYLWKIAFLFLIISGALGFVMRLQFFSSVVDFNYQHVLHAHSHIVLLGWVFNTFMAGFHYMLFKKQTTKKHVLLYSAFQISILGMLLSFPVQGYAAISITFSTLHILLSYVWAMWIWGESTALDSHVRSFLKWGLIYLIISTLGPFSLGAIIATGGSGSDMYYMAVYFYLHFLYNGFFIFSLLAMFFWYLQSNNLFIDPVKGKRLLSLMNVQCILGLTLSSLWMHPHPVIYSMGALAGLIQIIALVQFVFLIKPIWKSFIAKISEQAALLIKICSAGLILKIVLQAISAIPVVADLAYEVRNITIGYLHLVFLGIVTPFLFAWFNMQRMMPLQSALKKWGLGLFIVGFTISELLIVTPGVWAPAYYFKLLFIVSLILWIGIVLIFPGQRIDNEALINHTQ